MYRRHPDTRTPLIPIINLFALIWYLSLFAVYLCGHFIEHTHKIVACVDGRLALTLVEMVAETDGDGSDTRLFRLRRWRW